MFRSRGLGRLGLLAVGLGIGAALAATPGVASADPSTDPFSWIGGMDLGDLSVPAQTSALDIQVSIFGLDLFPTAGNTATASSGLGDIAIAFGNGASADAGSVGPSFFDIAFADGTNSTADANGAAGLGSDAAGSFDSALVFGANSTAEAGAIPPMGVDAFAIPGFFDLAAVFGPMLDAGAFGIGTVDIAP